MKALRLLAPNDLRYMDVPSPVLPEGWCRIKIKAVGVCGSDISSIAGRLVFTKYPGTPGHEFSGIVTEINNCSKIKEGMFVTANPVFGCGECPECKIGNFHHCAQTENLGVVNYDGAYAEEVIMPEDMVFELPGNITPVEGAMVEAVNVAARALECAKVTKGSKVAIFGAGNIGLLIVRLAKVFGADHVLTIDTVESRLEIAKQMGSDEVITFAELNANIEKYANQFTATIDGVSIESTVATAAKLIAPGGIVEVYGVPAGTFPVPVLDIFKKDASMVTSRLYPRDLSRSIELVAGKHIDFEPMITTYCSLKEFAELSKKIIARETDTVKVIILPEKDI